MWWSEAEGHDIDVNDVCPLAGAAYICIKLHSARYPDLAPCQLPDLRQPARYLTDLLTTLAAILGRRQPNVPPLHTAHVVHEVVAEEYRILESLRGSLLPDCPASSAALPTGDWLTALTARARSFRISCKLGLVFRE